MTTVEALALALAWDRCRDEPNEQDMADADVMVARWNKRRIELGLMPWE